MLRIGQTSNRGTADGQFIMGAGAAITATVVNVGMGAGASGTLTALADVLTFSGADSELNFGTGRLEVPGGSFTVGSAADPLANVRIGYNNAGTGTATTAIDLTVADPTFTAFIADDLSIGRETGAATFATSRADGSLTLGSNSSITLGSAATPATLNIGWSQNTNSSGGASASAAGMLDATEKAAELDLTLSELNVGRGSSQGFGSGTLRWDQEEVIAAASVIFGRGNATGILEVPESGELHLGTETDPLSFFGVAFNDVGSGTATATLDLTSTVADPAFTAFIADDLSIGRETGAATFATSRADGSLTLGSNSSITLGSAATPATLNIGWSQNTNSSGGASASVTGVLDTTLGSFTADLSVLRIGQTSNRGTADGQFIVGNGVDLDGAAVNIGLGSGAIGTLTFVDNFAGSFQAATVDLNAGLFDFGNNTLAIGDAGSILVQAFDLTGGVLAGDTVDFDPTTGTFDFSGGTLAVETFDGMLDQNGGTVAPGGSVGTTTINGDYELASAGTLEIEIDGNAGPGVGFDQLIINGTVNLNADMGTGGSLNVVLGFTPTARDTFTIIDNDGVELTIGFFDGLPNLSTFEETVGSDTVTFQIDYAGGDGNDVDLIVTDVAPSAVATMANQAMPADGNGESNGDGGGLFATAQIPLGWSVREIDAQDIDALSVSRPETARHSGLPDDDGAGFGIPIDTSDVGDPGYLWM